MESPPLSHHDIMRLAAPLIRRGIQVDLARSDRVNRYIEFQPQPSGLEQTVLVFTLNARIVASSTAPTVQLNRLLITQTGLVSRLSATVDDLDSALNEFEQIPLNRQLVLKPEYSIALTYTLKPARDSAKPIARLKLHYGCARVAGLELRVDTSTGGAMPADARLLIAGSNPAYLRDRLANDDELPHLHQAARSHAKTGLLGGTAVLDPATEHVPMKKSGIVTNLPDDLLAVLGPQWRPLQPQGDHWKCVFRTLGKEPGRTPRATAFLEQAALHVHAVLSQDPLKFHERLSGERWRVYVRRLQPLMVFMGILSLMPLSWLFVSRGELVLHPLALSLTPLLMVGVVALTAREIPVMEIPPKPRPLPSGYWTNNRNSSHA